MENLIINLDTVKSKDGELNIMEFEKKFFFEVKRIYCINNVKKNKVRGFHAHKKLNQVLWCPQGKIEVILDNGYVKKTYILDTPSKALLVLEGYWHTMKWKNNNSVLCCAASDIFNENDYIRDYNEFIEYIERDYWNGKNKL